VDIGQATDQEHDKVSMLTTRVNRLTRQVRGRMVDPWRVFTCVLCCVLLGLLVAVMLKFF
jgi:hypothetical protein